MLQKTSDDGSHVHVLGLARNTGLEARDAANDHVHAHAGTRCLGNLVDDLAVGKRVELKEHAGGLADKGALNLAVQAAHDERFQSDGRHTQEAVVAAQVAQRQIAEEQVGVFTDAGMGCHEHKVAVEFGRLLVKVAGAQKREAGERHALAIGELADLGVALKAFGAVDDGAACLFQTLGPLDVVLLVKAGAELHEHRDLFAVLGSIDQRLAQAALLGHAVERDAQRDALGVVGGLVHQIQEGVHGLVGIKEQLVVLQHLLADGAGHVDGGIGLRPKRRKEQLVAQVLGNLALNAKDVAQVERDIAGKDRAARKLERLADGLERCLLERPRDREHYRLQTQALLEDALHVLAVVLFLFDALAVRIDVGVAGDADQRTIQRLIGAKAAVQAGEDDVLEQDVGVGAGGRGDLDHAVHRGGNLDKAQQALLVGGAVQTTGQIERAIA